MVRDELLTLAESRKWTGVFRENPPTATYVPSTDEVMMQSSRNSSQQSGSGSTVLNYAKANALVVVV